MNDHTQEITSGERFGFGSNWTRFLTQLNDKRIYDAECSLQDMLGLEDLTDKTFLDIGSGSGLFSLAARRLGAKVHSFDYDPQSVACTEELRRRYFSEDRNWTVEKGSALDTEYLSNLGQYDVVYSWGVLHHTGNMWKALDNVVLSVKSGGMLFIAIYNDQGWISSYWTEIKKIFISGAVGRTIIIIVHIPYLLGVRLIFRALAGRLHLERGMTYWYDMLDWLGGWPFEVSSPRKIINFYRKRNFSLERAVTCGNRSGCNEFVFTYKNETGQNNNS